MPLWNIQEILIKNKVYESVNMKYTENLPMIFHRNGVSKLEIHTRDSCLNRWGGVNMRETEE